MQKVYFISGLGADERAFQFLDLTYCEPVFISWAEPLPNETLQGYAFRLKEQITDANPIVVGLSFGGMLVSEMAKADASLKGIIISSNKTSKEFPAYWRIGKYFPLYRWLPMKPPRNFREYIGRIFGTPDKERSSLLFQLIDDSNPAFIRWAIKVILRWKSETVPANITHIHGNTDLLLPLRYVKADYVIEGGSHFMIVVKSREISRILKKIITGTN